MPQQPAIGADVSALMPPVGADVSSLMGGSMPAAAPPQAPMPDVAQIQGPDGQMHAIDRNTLTYKLGDVLGNVLYGAVKGAGQTATNFGEMVRSVPGVTKAVDTLYGQPGLSDAAFSEAHRVLKPTNTAQSVGKFGEQIAETLAPTKALTSLAGKAVGAVAPKLAPIVGEAAARILPRAAVEGAGGAAMSAAQGGDPLTGGVMSAVLPPAASAIGSAASGLRASAKNGVVQALGATKERYKAMSARLAPEILKRGIRGSREGIAEKAATAAEAAGEQIDEALQQFGSRQVGTQPVVDALEKAKDAFRVTTDAPVRVRENAPAFFAASTKATQDQIWFSALSDARQSGYKGTVGELREKFLKRVDQAKSLEAEIAAADEYSPEALLKEIKRLGGIKPFTIDYVPGTKDRKMRGDFAAIVEGFGAKSTWGQKGGASIFRKNGLGMDDLVGQLRADPRWEHLVTDENSLLDVLDDIARQGPSNTGAKGLEHYLDAAGVKPGTKWWESAGGPRVVEIEPRALRQLDSLQSTIKDLGDDASVEHLVAVRRAWDSVVAQAGGFAHRTPGGIGIPLKDTTEAWAKREGAGAIRKLLDDEVPELTKINKEYHFWKSLDEVVSQTLKRTQPHGASLTGTIKEAGGQAVGAMVTKGGIGGAFALGKVARMANAVFTSPRWRLASAQMKDSLASAIETNDVGQIATALARISAVQGSKVGAQ